MFIHIDYPAGPHIHIPIPNVLLFRQTLIKMTIDRAVEERKVADIESNKEKKKLAKELSAALRFARKHFGRMELVRVESSDGVRVRIVL